MSDILDQYPEHAKLDAKLSQPITKTHELSQAIGYFLDWQREEHLGDAEDPKHNVCYGCGRVTCRHSTTELLGLYFLVDPKALNEEKEQMLQAMRNSVQDS